MTGQDKFNKLVAKYPHPHRTFFQRPHWTRREFFQVGGAGVCGSFLTRQAKAFEVSPRASVSTQNKARNCIFILLTGAPSHTDTFDLKTVNGITPANFNPTTVNGGVRWPMGLLPKLGQQLPNVAIVRSMRSWALVHSLGQRWTQIGRNPAAALGDVAPNIGSVVAREKDGDRTAGQVFPTFLALNSPSAAGQGYYSAQYSPFKVAPSTAGIPDTTNPNGQSRLDTMWNHLHTLDDPLRVNSPLGQDVTDYAAFYQAAKGMMFNPTVSSAFSYSSAESVRYGSTTFGNSCLIAKQVLAANQGTRFIQISLGSWDMHQDIYGAVNPKGNNLYTMSKTFDDGIGALLADLQATGMLNSTLVVMVGEFGRTVGALSAAGGRDHLLQQSALFAGAGIKGGRAIGATNDAGDGTMDPGWSRQRDIKPEDIEATIYSAMGIDWTKVQYDDPFHRGFEYVPFSDQDLYGPINELWAG